MKPEEKQVQQDIVSVIGGSLLPQTSYQIFREKLAEYISELIDQNFEQLVLLLYRLDVNEKKLKSLLASANTDSAILIVDLIIERQLQKIHTRKQFSKPAEDIPEVDKW